MPKINTLQSNFTAGQLSPELYGRVDLQRYNNAAKTLKNVVALVFGGARRRYGTSKQGATLIPGRRVRLVPFVVSRSLAYVLEFGHLYFRVYRNDGALMSFSGVTPYTEDQLNDVDFVQGADEMYLAHPDVPIQRLKRFTDTSWNMGAAPFTTTPFEEQGRYPVVLATLSSAALGAGRHLYTGVNTFLPADVQRAVSLGAGIAVITGYVGPQEVVVQINSPFADVNLLAGTWNLDASPMATISIGDTGPVGKITNFHLDAAGLRGDEVGQFIRMNGGLIKITGVDPAGSDGNGQIIVELDSVNAAPALAWSLESGVWGGSFGYPRTLSLHEQRLIAGGTKKKPQTIWGSRTGEELDFTLGVLDDEAFSFTIQADEVNPIAYLVSARSLITLTDGGEFSVQGGVEKPISATSIQIKPQSPYGSLNVRPVNVGKEVMFVQRAGRKIRSLSYQYTSDGYVAPDITKLSENITESGLVDMAYQQEPDQVLWAVRADGVLISCTIDREQDVIAWCPHETDGRVERIVTVPGRSGTDELWLIVNRVIGGVETRFVERMEAMWNPFDTPESWGYQVDCATAFINPEGAMSFGGLDYLEGKQVEIVADGSPQPPQIVVDGHVSIPRPGFRVLIGLPYESEIETLRPELATQDGTAQGAQMHTSKIVLRFKNTIGAMLNGEVIPFKKFDGSLLGQRPKLYSGDVDAVELGWEQGDSPMSIKQTRPLPFQLLAIVRTLTVNKG